MNDDDPSEVVGLDAYLNLLMVFLLLLAIIIHLLNPPAEEAKAEPPGNLAVCIYWDKGPFDVDLWMDGPTEVRPVGYSHRGGVYINLLRDDLGTQLDPTDVNFECSYTRGVRDGEHIINLHCYRCGAAVTVNVEVSIMLGGNLRKLAATVVKMARQGEEKTALRFVLEGDRIEPGSMHNVFRPLRSATK